VTSVRASALCAPLLCAGQPLGLLQDAGSGVVALWSGEALHEVAMSNEDKDMWRIYLEHQVRTAPWEVACLRFCLVCVDGTAYCLFRVCVTYEDKDMWRIYLEHQVTP
jgi:hypothetical protein